MIRKTLDIHWDQVLWQIQILFDALALGTASLCFRCPLSACSSQQGSSSNASKRPNLSDLRKNTLCVTGYTGYDVYLSSSSLAV